MPPDLVIPEVTYLPSPTRRVPDSGFGKCGRGRTLWTTRRHALDEPTQEMHIAATQLTDDEYLTIIRGIKKRSIQVRGDGGQPATETGGTEHR